MPVVIMLTAILLYAELLESRFAQSLTFGANNIQSDAVTNNILEPIIFSHFDGTDTEDWSMYLGTLHNPGSGGSGGGEGNGYLRTSPPSDNRTSYFVAPVQYHGNWSNYTELRFDMWSQGGTYYSSGYSMYGDVFLESHGKTAYMLLPKRPDTDWETFVVSLDDSEDWVLGGGAASIHEILLDVTDFQLRAEYGVGVDHTGLDNVEIFGTLSCEVPFFSQRDERWSGHQLGSCTGNCSTVGNCGCTLTSASMLFAYYGANLTPATLNSCMGLLSCPFHWWAGANCSNDSASWVNDYLFSWQRLEQELNENGRPVLLEMRRVTDPRQTHWVVMISGTGDDPANYIMHDPWPLGGANMRLSTRSQDYYFTRIAVYDGEAGCSVVNFTTDASNVLDVSPVSVQFSSGDQTGNGLTLRESSIVTGTAFFYHMTEITMTVQLTATSSVGDITEMLVWTDSDPNPVWQPFSPFAWLPVSEFIYARFRDEFGNESGVVSDSIFPIHTPPDFEIQRSYLPLLLQNP
jgi:hypothetical protein